MNEIESLKVFELIEGFREHCFVELAGCPVHQLVPVGWRGPWKCAIRPRSLFSDESYIGYGDTPLKALAAAIATFPPGVVT